MTKFKEIPMEKLVSRQIKLWDITFDPAKADTANQIKPCITISKELGSKGVELGQRLSENLNWKLFDKDLVEFIARSAEVRKEMVEIFDEKTQNEIHSWVVTLLNRHALGSDQYFRHLGTVIRTIGEHGQAIILGRGGNFILPPEKALRVKTTAPLKKRIDYIMRTQKLGKNEAERIIFTADKQRLAFIRRFFHKDTEDPLYYDLVLNMGSLSLVVAEAIVMQALKAKFPKVFSS